MTIPENANANAAALAVELTPTQIKGLKLAKDGDLHPQDAKRWTHLNATVTYAKSDRFKERPIKVKFATTQTVNELRNHGLVRALDEGVEADQSAHSITMAGKIWLMKNV
ncbi:hypothetical protein [Oryzifoliimicrobium ureilyticus]|uniref:hypothetical protein n=1 Tax=Oryzifoliimicrobium ureilyticus TaxID=3113724 RepID=UPI003076141C